MKNSLFFVVFIAGMMFAGCQNASPDLNGTQKAEIEKQILDQWGKVGIAVQKADAVSYATFFSRDNFLAMYSEGTPFLSLKDYSDSVKVWFSSRKGAEVLQPDIKVRVLSANMALLDQKSIFRLILKDDRVMQYNHAVSFIFSREASGWKIIHGHESWTGI